MSLSKELFGIEQKKLEDKAYTCKESCVDIGYNKAISLIDQFEISEEELAKAIYDEIYFNTGHGWVLARKIAKAIIQNKPKIFKRKG